MDVSDRQTDAASGEDRPRIGMCVALERARWSVWDLRAMLLPSNYVEAVQRAGGLALMLPVDPRLVEAPWEVLDMLDGLLLAGGADIDPGSYGETAHPETVDTVPERDAFELALTRAAIARGMPVLGICRGMQLINVALGGTLVQHLPEHYGHHEHRRAIGSFDGADHDVLLSENTVAARAAGELHHATKSHHHQGVATLGAGLCVSGVSTLDQLPEAIELEGGPQDGGPQDGGPAGHPFVLGVQWHPEADPSSRVIAAFVAAAGARRAERVVSASG